MTNTLIAIEDLVPEEASFYLAKNQKTYTIRPVNVEDWVWLRAKYGEELLSIIRGTKWMDTCGIIFRLLSNEDKRDFKAQDVEKWDEHGNMEIVRMGGGELLAYFISGVPEFLKVNNALSLAIGAGEPKRIEVEIPEDEKKALDARAAKKAPTKRNVETCWGEIFDLIAHEYGYTFKQIRQMTYREIVIACEKINRRLHNNYVMQATLHGAKNVNLIPSASCVDVDRSEENNKLVDKAMTAAMERKRKEFIERGKRK